ncbi:RimK family alpha-L-glutamate ligase [Zeaxanthinibacter sp. PT1]|uniref:RimK family alpha-L-glutamate ligase n=1 Tax=Zeaxanthinibacter TaxID=561554 RepID=UPI00234B2AA0|nr:RimK family alpha-L-glutamate ligase [Zeaxanthinibacter sp. PT1]MDC6350543.1 RimK family alpha-L-glutamate ligase [Zeaxanthinibacter sp. PT1]
MDIGLLSVSRNVYSTHRIAEEAQRRDHYIELIDHMRCSVQLGNGAPRIFLDKDEITHSFDAIIPRIGTKVTAHGAMVVKQFELNGIFSSASSGGITRARNKVKTLQLLSRKKIPIVPTLITVNPSTLEEQIDLLGGPPVIIKLQEGTQGIGVILAETTRSARSIVDTLNHLDTDILIQKYIEESNGEDLRLFVVGQKVVGSMKRFSAVGDFRSNMHRGGSAEAIIPTAQESHMALKAVKHLGLGIAGVDMVRSHNGPLLLEVNASPGLEALEAATSKNIAKEIVCFVEKNAKIKKTL